MPEQVIAIHFGPKEDSAVHDKIVDRMYGDVIQHINQAGHYAVITRGVESYDFEGGKVSDIWIPEVTSSGVRTRLQLGSTALSEFGAVRDLGQLLRPTAEHPLALLNDPSITAIDHSKAAANRLLADMQARTVVLDPQSMQEVEMLDGDMVIVKPDHGSGGRGVRMAAKSMVASLVAENPDTRLIAQEYIASTDRLPSGLRGIEPQAQEVLDAADGRAKELRNFMFYNRKETEIVPVARIMKQGDEKSDTWVGLDALTLPDEVMAMVVETGNRLSVATGVPEIYGAVDIVWGTTPKSDQCQALIGEVNLWMPAGSRKHPDIAQMHDQALVKQLIRMAESREV